MASGKSTLSYVLTGKDGYEVTGWRRQRWMAPNLLDMAPEDRAAKGLFLSFQYPMEIAGRAGDDVRAGGDEFAQRKTRGEPEVSAPEFLKLSKVAAAKLRIDPDMLKRPLNVGFSGGEKKRLEIYQMLMIEPRFMILDETDSVVSISMR